MTSLMVKVWNFIPDCGCPIAESTTPITDSTKLDYVEEAVDHCFEY